MVSSGRKRSHLTLPPTWLFRALDEAIARRFEVECDDHSSRIASIVICAFSTFETGHPDLALLAAVSKAS